MTMRYLLVFVVYIYPSVMFLSELMDILNRMASNDTNHEPIVISLIEISIVNHFPRRRCFS